MSTFTAIESVGKPKPERVTDVQLQLAALGVPRWVMDLLVFIR
jgi:hypothetical protein